MRTVALAALLALAVPVRAQRAADVPGRAAPVVLSETPSALSLGQLFSAETLDFSQSYEASYGVGAGGSLGMGIYTTTLKWQPSTWLAGRVDVGVMHGLGGSLAGQLGPDSPQVFLRNAELAIRPTESMRLHLSVQQSPYGSYASPYGYGGGYGSSRYGSRTGLGLSTGGSDDLFFRDTQ